jgi:hypothetical protein
MWCFSISIITETLAQQPDTNSSYSSEKRRAMVQVRRSGCDPRPVHVGLIIDKEAMGQLYIRALRSSPVNVIPPMLHIHSLIYHRRYIISSIDSVVKQQI